MMVRPFLSESFVYAVCSFSFVFVHRHVILVVEFLLVVVGGLQVGLPPT